MLKWYLLIGAIVFSVAPLWIPYALRMWGQGHYQYFPLLLAAVAGLLGSRRAELITQATNPAPWLLGVGLLGVALSATGGHLLLSGLLGILTTILALVVLIYGGYGAGGLKAAAPVLWLLIFAIPLPLGLDQSLILKMQFLASRLASHLLDGLGVMHFREGVLLVTEKSRFMTEEACSGIRSLFSSMAVVSIYGVSLRHGWIRVGLNLLQTVFWVLIGNAVRVAAVVILADNVDPWYATGTGHEMLGMVVFAFILGMVVSTDSLMSLFVNRPFVNPTEFNAKAAREDSLPDFPFPSFASWLVFGMFCFVGVVGLRVAYVSQRGSDSIRVVDLPAPSEADLPLVMDGWKRESFEHVERAGDPLFASHSYIWKYSNGRSVILVSVDSPWAEWHNLAVCYSALGWEMEAKYFVENSEALPDGRPMKTQSELLMTKGDRSGFVIFAVVDRAGAEIFPGWRNAMGSWWQLPGAFMQQAAASLGFGLETQFAIGGFKLPATTIQVLTESSEPFKPEELEEIRRMYDLIRRTLLASPRWATAE